MQNNNYIEQKIAEYEKRTGIKLDVHNKSTLRDILRKEDAYWERYEGREETGHSHSAVGDAFNMGTNRK